MYKQLFSLTILTVPVLLSGCSPQTQIEGSSFEAEVTPVVNEQSKIECNSTLTLTLTEGPYFTPSSPEKTDLYSDRAKGNKIIISGYVLDKNCNPIPNSWLDFWQTDEEGNYDNSGYNLRGHQYTDAEGKYILTTVIPGEYSGRTPHIHVKVRASESESIITSQLFIPGVATNEQDSIYDNANLITMKGSANATFNFVVSTD